MWSTMPGDIVIEKAGGGTDTVRSRDQLHARRQFENLVLTGTADLNGTGNSLANVIFGNAGNNILDGGAGADDMEGGAGNDTYWSIVQNDLVTEDFNSGTDTVIASPASCWAATSRT